MNIKERFSESQWNLIQDVLQNGKEKSWFELAQRHSINLEGSYSQRRKSANDIWRRFTSITNKENIDLVTIKQTFNKDGEIVFETKKFKESNTEVHPSILEGKVIKKITTNPNGKPWVTWVTPQENRVSDDLTKEKLSEWIKEVFEKECNPPIHFKFDSQFSFINQSLLVYTSDKHIGAKTQSNSIYQNEYNAQEFERRMMTIARKIAQLGPMEHLIIFDLGDALDGFNGQTTRGGHTLPQNMNNKEQFQTYLEVHKKFFDHILTNGNAYNNISFICAANNNHGGDADYMAMTAFEMYLQKVNPFIKVHVSDKFIDHVEVKNGSDLLYTILFTHGKDDADMKHGLPLILNDKVENYINNYIDYHGIDARKPIHFIKGDLHQSATQYAKRFRYKNVGSIYGSSKWIHTNFGNTKPICDMDIIETNCINEIRLFL